MSEIILHFRDRLLQLDWNMPRETGRNWSNMRDADRRIRCPNRRPDLERDDGTRAPATNELLRR